MRELTKEPKAIRGFKLLSVRTIKVDLMIIKIKKWWLLGAGFIKQRSIATKTRNDSQPQFTKITAFLVAYFSS